ncbi:hypothetical protein [Mycobacteroides abscessus]|uniref:hypothetical protein n=1 Tax=Mycobacteroides abscessus TaxID=36809 RepID=UPI00030805B0|nr:hypothetical protein [Mycobacteroides abscessus]
MPDPSISAAQRALDGMPALSEPMEQPVFKALLSDIGAAAAREMARPIREYIEKIPAGLDATDLYDELDFIYRRLLGGHCEECRDD